MMNFHVTIGTRKKMVSCGNTIGELVDAISHKFGEAIDEQSLQYYIQ